MWITLVSLLYQIRAYFQKWTQFYENYFLGGNDSQAPYFFTLIDSHDHGAYLVPCEFSSFPDAS